MVLIPVFNTVNNDGIGDFSHFEDIMEALLTNERFKAVKFITFVNFDKKGSPKNFARIENKLNTGLRQQYPQRIQVHFGDFDFHDKLRQSPKLQATLAQAVKGIIVSFDGTAWGRSLVKCYADYCESLGKIPFTYITEHEATHPAYPKEGRVVNYNTRTLGLYDGLDKYTFVKSMDQENIKDNHVYLSKDDSNRIISCLKKDTDGKATKGYPDLNCYQNVLNYLDDKEELEYLSKKEILIQAWGACRIDDEIPVQEVCGIKLKTITRLEPQQAWDIIEQQEPTFVHQLLTQTVSANLDQLMENNLIIPVYLNIHRHVMFFCCFLSNNTLARRSDSVPKNVVIYLSGCKIESKEDFWKLIELYKDTYDPQFNTDSISNQNLTPHQNITTITCPHCTIRIFSGFYLNDSAYDAIYHLARVAVASGDNTLERCVSMNIMPFYWSTNHSSDKWKTILALQHITQRPDVLLSDQARHSFEIFFKTTQRWATISMPFRHEGTVDFPKIIDEWPIVADYLQKNKNFYHHLESIIFLRLSQDEINACQHAIDLHDGNLLNTNELLEDATIAIAALEKPEITIVTDETIQPPSAVQVLSQQTTLQVTETTSLSTPNRTPSPHIDTPIPTASQNTNDTHQNNCWQLFYDCFNTVYNLIIRMLRHMIVHCCYSPQLFQPTQNGQYVAVNQVDICSITPSSMTS